MQALWRMFIRCLMLKSKKTGEKLNAERFKQNMAQDSLVAADMKLEIDSLVEVAKEALSKKKMLVQIYSPPEMICEYPLASSFMNAFLAIKDAIRPISYISDKSLTGDTGHKKSKKGTRILEGFVYLCIR